VCSLGRNRWAEQGQDSPGLTSVEIFEDQCDAAIAAADPLNCNSVAALVWCGNRAGNESSARERRTRRFNP